MKDIFISKTLIVTHIALNRASFEIPIYMFSIEHLNRMKRIFTALISTVLLATTVSAQAPANDNCSGVFTLTPTPVGGACPTTVYNNINATDATGANNSPNPLGFNGSRAFKDVWFKFRTTTGTNVNYRVTVKGTTAADSIKNPQLALYVGDCNIGLVEEYSATKDVGAANSNTINIDGGCMRPNTDYYIQVANYQSSDAGGTFTVCVEPIDPIYVMKVAPQTTSACLGTLYDSGGPTANYSSNENRVFNIRPPGTGCIEITVDSFAIESNFDSLMIYDGATGVLLTKVTSKITDINSRKVILQVPSSWVRVVFKSDGSNTARGFKLSWRSLLTCTAPAPTTCAAPEIIPSLPFTRTNVSNCNDAITTITTSPCIASSNTFLEGNDHVYKFSSAGGQCVSIVLSNFGIYDAGLAGMNFGLYRNCPSGPGSECIGTGKLTTNRDSSVIKNISLTIAGDYFLVVSSKEACTNYDIRMDTISCLNNLPNAGSCNKALSLNDCSNQTTSDVLLDLSTPGDGTFMNFATTPRSINSGCILSYGGTPPRTNFTFMYFKAQASGKFGFMVGPIITSLTTNPDIDFNVYGPIDSPNDICNFVKTTAPARSSYTGSVTGPGGGLTGLADTYRTPAGTTVSVNDVYDCETGGNNDGVVSRMDVVKDKYYLVWINDYSGTIGRDGVRLNFGGTSNGVLDSVQDPLAQFKAGRDTALCIGGSTQLFAQGGITYKWTPALGLGLNQDTIARPTATPTQSTTYSVAIQGTCRLVGKKVEVLVFKVNDIANQTVCRNEDLVFNAGDIYPATTGAVWSWTSSTGHISELSCTNCPKPTFRATGAAGAHTFTVTLTTPSCTLTKTVTITVTGNAAPVFNVITALTPTRDTNVCSVGAPFNLLKAGFDATAIYTWTSAPVSSPAISGSNPSVQPTVSTKYYVSATGGVGGCAAESKDSVIVNVFLPPVLNTINDTALCRDLILSMGNTAVQANTGYSWNNISGFDNPTSVNPKLTVRPNLNTYTLTATNIGGCVTRKTINVTGINLALNIAPDTLQLCRGTARTLTASVTPANAKIKWSSNRDFTIPIDSTTSTITVTPITRSRYYADVTLTNTSPAGTCRRIDSVDVYVDSLPLNRNILPKDTVVCRGTLILFRSPVYEPIFYPTLKFVWTPRFGAITPDSFYNFVISADSTRTYTRTATNGACVAKDTVKVIVNQIPTLVLPAPSNLCEPTGAITLNVTTRDSMVTGYKWKINGVDAPGSDGKTSITLSPTIGTTTISVTAKIGDCPGSTSTTITVNPAPSVTFPPPPTNIVCPGGSIVLNLTPNAGYTYTWTGTGITTPTASAPSVSPTTDNNKYVVVVRNATTGCTKTDSGVVRLASATLATIADKNLCSGTPNQTITAVGTDNIGNGQYSWSPTGVSVNGATITVSSATTATYTVTYTYGRGCTLSTTAKVTSVPGFFLRINPDTFSLTKLVDQGTPITLTTVATGNTGTLSYVWTGDGNALGTTPAISFKALADVTYKVAATSSTGCTKDTSVRMLIRFPNYQLPNAFTPNGDTINSNFGPIFNGLFPPSPTNQRPDFWKGRIEVVSFQVYNRWGQEVYSETSSTVLNATTYKGWDGKKGGNDVASDVYVYLIKLKMPDDTIKAESGELNLIR